MQITQTHIHFASNAFADEFTVKADTGKAAKLTGKISPQKKLPADDPANCPICQAVAHSGQFLTPAAIGLVLPSETVVIVPLAIAANAARETISHSWQSRAPPTH